MSLIMRTATKTDHARPAGVNCPRLSVVVNNYNYARYLPEALDSAIRQLREGDEIVVVDDGSTDGSPAVLAHYQTKYGINLIQQQNHGQMRAVRVGIEAARGDIIVLLDSDDYFLDGYLDRLRQIYMEHPDVSYVFCDAILGGDSEAGSKSMRGILDRMELTPGEVGTTKWATLLFHEFVGVPTSGNSLHRSLANKIITLPATVDETAVLSPGIAGILGISEIEQKKSGFTADGVIVRSASLLQSRKYYDDRPGFMYRIHGSNKYASTNRLGRWYLRRRRKKVFKELVSRYFGLSSIPTALELREEILGRSFGRHWFRHFYIRANYCRAILGCKGSFVQKVNALTAALGFQRRRHRAP
jgi:glycosyltransferase involved in cell wall biosynthesis